MQGRVGFLRRLFLFCLSVLGSFYLSLGLSTEVGVSLAGCGPWEVSCLPGAGFCSEEFLGLGLAAGVGGNPCISQGCGYGAPRLSSQ